MQKLKTISVRAGCVLLLLLSVWAYLFPSWVSVSNIRAKTLREANEAILTETDSVRDFLLAGGVPSGNPKKTAFSKLISEEFKKTDIKRFTNHIKTNIEMITDAKLSMTDLYSLAGYGVIFENALNRFFGNEKYERSATERGIAKEYEVYHAIYETTKSLAWLPFVLMLVLSIFPILTIWSAVNIAIGKKSALQWITAIFAILLAIAAVGGVIYGNSLLSLMDELPDPLWIVSPANLIPSIRLDGFPKTMELAISFAPIAVGLLPIGALILNGIFEKKKQKEEEKI